MSLLTCFFVGGRAGGVEGRRVVAAGGGRVRRGNVGDEFVRFGGEFIPTLSKTLVKMVLVDAAYFTTNANASTMARPLRGLGALVVTIVNTINIVVLTGGIVRFTRTCRRRSSSAVGSTLGKVMTNIVVTNVSAMLAFLNFWS